MSIEAAKAEAHAIFEDYAAWERDQDEPPTLREGFLHPGARALTLARLVLHLPTEDTA